MSVANSAEVIKTQRLFSSRSYDSSNEENDSVDSICSGEGDSEPDYDQNSDEEDCFCVASDTERCGLDDEIDSLDGDDLYAVHVGVETADPLCVKLNDLIKRGKIPKERILYRYLNDVVEIMYNPFHKYDPEVVEFFNTITYLGGKRTANFIRGPMNVGDGRHSHLNHEQDKKINLGGPSESLIQKSQAGYTPESGVIKPLSLGHIELLKNSEAKPLIKTANLLVIPCALANDGTALKPAIEFDARLKENVGLKFPVDLEYIKKNQKPSPEHLRDNIITEAIVSSLTSLDNFCSLPVAVDYSTQSGKTGQTMSSLFEEHIKTLQVCQACQERLPGRRHIISSNQINCTSFCHTCYDAKTVCPKCKVAGQVSYVPSLRACDACLGRNIVCTRRVVMVLCSDCETGNKNAFEILNEKLEKGVIDPYLEFLSILPDCPHVGKSMKAAFSNWWLKCKDERINLGLLRTVRNRSDKATKDCFRKLIPKNDHVKNKDRQDPSSVLTLSAENLTDALKDIGYVCHTIVPELDKYSADNQRGMYPCPISIAVPSYGWIAFLSFDAKNGSSTLFKARLHSPVDKITVLSKNLKVKQIHCSDGIIYLTSDKGPIRAIEFSEGTINMISKEKKRKDDLVNLARKLKVSPVGTVAEISSRLKKYFESVKNQYQGKSARSDEINFWDKEIQPSFEAMVCVASDLIYAAEVTNKSIVSIEVERDGVGLKGNNLQRIVSYGNTWGKVYSMCLSNRNLFVSHVQGISMINMETSECQLAVKLDDEPCVLTRFSTDVLFTNQKKSSIWQLSGNGKELRLFAGSDKEDGNIDGPIKECRFKQPVGICTEFDGVVYVCDAQTNSIKICTKLKECAHFLSAIGCLYEAFSVHQKGAQYTVKTGEEAIGLVRQCRRMLDENTYDIQETTGITRSLNGPQGHVSARTVASVSMIEKGLQRLYTNLENFDYENTLNLLSCMTLDVENCHATVHVKQANMSMAEYCRSFGLAMKEAVKRVTSWAAYYHTSRRSWYPKPEGCLQLSQVPIMKPLPSVSMSSADCNALRDWASSYGAAVRQRTVRQETTMAKHGTLPEFMYQRQCNISENPVSIAFDERVNRVEDANENNSEEDESDAEFDESSDEDVEDHGREESLLQGEIGSSATFLLGAKTRFGRVVRFNNRLLY